MTADRRLMIGGWAALVTAILVPARFVGLYTAPGGVADPFRAAPVRIIEAGLGAAILIAALGLATWFAAIAPAAARPITLVGVGGGLGTLALTAADLAGVGAGTPSTIGILVASILTGLWFIGGGAIVMVGGLVRIGWTAEIGGLGMILSAVATSVRFGGVAGATGTGLMDWFLIVGLFVVIYLVRTWSYVVRGKLPGPGIL